ncbi:MAG TPA: hypothetical protein VJU34_10205 [Phenylobacterium sp.]|nr:hypothetical protein [Phenylobacterium sp.]
MSETVSPRVTAFAEQSDRAGHNRPLPLGYGLLIAVLLSIGLWVGLGVTTIRLWF